MQIYLISEIILDYYLQDKGTFIGNSKRKKPKSNLMFKLLKMQIRSALSQDIMCIHILVDNYEKAQLRKH